jgi:5-methylcytosine-specific restriction endonuclease McrA
VTGSSVPASNATVPLTPAIAIESVVLPARAITGPSSQPRTSAAPTPMAIESKASEHAPQAPPSPASIQSAASERAPALPPPRRATVEPLAYDRYAVRFTASARCRALLDRAKQLLSHRSPNADAAEVVEAALEVLVEKLEKQKFKTTSRPRQQKHAEPDSHRVPAQVAREVRARDEDRCTYLGPDGHRCDARGFLEYDHVIPRALGGPSTADNLRLRCRTHNQLSAAHQFGDEYMTLMAQGFRPATRSRPRARSASLRDPKERSDPPSLELGTV